MQRSIFHAQSGGNDTTLIDRVFVKQIYTNATARINHRYILPFEHFSRSDHGCNSIFAQGVGIVVAYLDWKRECVAH